MNTPSAYQLEKVLSLAMQTVEALRTEHGQVLDTEDDILAALAEEGVDVATIIRKFTSAALDAKADVATAKSRIADLSARRDRFKRQEAAFRSTVRAVMEAILRADNHGVRRFRDAEFTLSLTPGEPEVIITDVDALPDDMVTVTVVTTTTRTPNEPKILAALLGNDTDIAYYEVMPGAILSKGSPKLTIRPK